MTEQAEHPHRVLGRLLESAHIAGYSFERAMGEFKWLLADDRWKAAGFESKRAFIASIDFSALRVSVEQRKELAKLMADEEIPQRTTARMLGVGKDTIARDLGRGANAPTTPPASAGSDDLPNPSGAHAPWFAIPSDPSKLAKTREREAKKRDDRIALAAELTGRNAALPVTERKYGAIYADPPWSFQVWSGAGKDRAAENHYPTMKQGEIEALPVASLAADDCVLFMWAVMPQLPEALAVIKAWGFEYKTCAFVWVKQTRDGESFATGMGYWTRANAEVCLLATRGSPQRLNADVHQVIEAPRLEHSAKPDEVAARIERLVPGPYLEMFARKSRPGWDAFGNQAAGAPLGVRTAKLGGVAELRAGFESLPDGGEPA